jgi:type I restriction enzyme R subunit
MLGLKQPLQLAQFKPALAINPDILARYAANRLNHARLYETLREKPGANELSANLQ